MLYFDHAATSYPKHPSIGKAIQHLLEKEAVNPGRGGYGLSSQLSRKVDQLRQELSQHYQLDDPQHVVLTSGCTSALNLAIHGWLEKVTGEDAEPGGLPRVLCSCWEHNSVLRPLYHWRDRGLIELTLLTGSAGGRFIRDDLLNVLDDRLSLVVVSQINNTTGVRQNLPMLGNFTRQHNIKLLVDAAQSSGHERTLMKSWGVDMLAMAAHKGWGGPTGIGALLLGPRMFDAEGLCLIQPMMQGGTGGDSLSEKAPAEMPVALESGTVNTVGVVGWLAAIKEVLKRWENHGSLNELSMISPSTVKMKELADELDQQLRYLPGITVYGPEDREHCSGILMFNFKDRPAQEAEQILDSVFQVAVRSGLHCSPQAHQALGTLPEGAIRVAFGPEHGEDELEQLLTAIREIEGST